MPKDFLLKGNILFTPMMGTLKTYENHYLYCKQGLVTGLFEEMPEGLCDVPLHDFTDQLIFPGLMDLHLHASQFALRGMGMDVQLLEWLDTYAFAEEIRFAQVDYARERYGDFVRELVRTPTTRAAIFATIHKEATEILMELLDRSGLGAFVGKLNMDRNSAASLQETTEESLRETEKWLVGTKDKYKRVKPMITPRFVPSCTGELMQGLGALSQKYKIPVQSHLSENLEEIKWVKELHPACNSYGDVYEQHNLFGGENACLMAHCNYSPDDELLMMKERGVIAVHCPQSNVNVTTGIAPVRNILSRGVEVGIGTDIAGGATLNMFRAMTDAIQMSKQRWIVSDKTETPLTIPEVLYMATKGGGKVFGRTGSFEDGYELDAVVVDDRDLGLTERLTLAQRVERAVYLTDDRHIRAKYVCGTPISLEVV